MILLRKGKTYRHMSCTEIDMHVIKIVYLGEKYFKLKVAWINQHYGYAYPQEGQVKLMREDLWKWREVDERI